MYMHDYDEFTDKEDTGISEVSAIATSSDNKYDKRLKTA